MFYKFGWHCWLLAGILLGCGTQEEPVRTESVAIIERKGNPYQRGIHYGTKATSEIRKQVTVWDELIRTELGLSQDSLYALIATKTDFLRTSERHAPEILREVAGIADGAAVSYKSLICLNLAEEIITYFSGGYHSCTNIGVSTSEHHLIGYNLDLPDFFRDFPPVILRDGQRYVYGFPGIVATGGMNEHFVVTTNSLPDLRLNLQGLPLPFLIRKLLQFSRADDAIAFLRAVPPGAPQNLMIGGRDGIRDFECSAGGVVEYYAPAKVFFHTNHPLVSQDRLIPLTRKDSCARFSFLTERFGSAGEQGEVDFAGMRELIGSTEGGIHNPETYLSVVARYPSDPKLLPQVEIIVPTAPAKKIYLDFSQQ
ncbi:MAG: C45 family peptidase [Bacteroidota bacterium]